MIKFLDLVDQYSRIKPEIDKAINDVVSNASFIGGETVSSFENQFASYCGSKYCVGVGNGTDALEIAIESLSLDPGSEIIVPGNSFIASSEAVTRAGHKVVFADSDPDNYTISIESIKEKLTENAKAIIVVHLYGHPCDMDSIVEFANQHNLKIVEDCAQAHGAEYKGRRVGSIGDIAAFSFYPGKNLGAYGDGGAIVTNNEQLSIVCRKIANHGRQAKYDHSFEGRNSRLDALQAAVLSVKLQYLEEWTCKRIEIADFYLENLAGVSGLVLPKREDWARQVYHLFVVRVDDRDGLQKKLKDADIQTGVHYPIALPKLEAYSYLNLDVENLICCKQDSQLLSLPIGDHLSLKDAELVVEHIKKALM